MSNNRMRMENIEAIVDGSGNIIGVNSPQGDVFFARALGNIAPVTHTGTTAKTKLGSIVIPGGSLGPNGIVRVTPYFTFTNNANAKTLAYEIGGVSLASLSRASVAVDANILSLKNRGNQNQQVSALGASVLNALTLDMSVDKTLDIFMTLGTGTDTCTFYGALVEVVPAA